jgi:membrane-bound serine protease (ClpP class)
VLFLIALVLAIFFLPSPWGIVLVVVAGVVDLTEIGIGLWWSRRRKATVGSEALVGAIGIAIEDLWPEGQVKVNGELWRAHCEGGCDAGTSVVVRRLDGLTLEVEPA